MKTSRHRWVCDRMPLPTGHERDQLKCLMKDWTRKGVWTPPPVGMEVGSTLVDNVFAVGKANPALFHHGLKEATLSTRRIPDAPK